MARGTVNKVILIGRLGQDPEQKYTPSGVAVTTLNLATNESYKNQQGEFVEKTEWHRIVLWRNLAENAAKYLAKGSQVYIEGKLQTRSWDDQNGAKHYTTEIVATDMNFLSTREGQGSQQNYQQQNQQSQQNFKPQGGYGSPQTQNKQQGPPSYDMPPQEDFKEDDLPF
jgi:single-strand DNA-binding protein